jgi:hypothetical protein
MAAITGHSKVGSRISCCYEGWSEGRTRGGGRTTKYELMRADDDIPID